MNLVGRYDGETFAMKFARRLDGALRSIGLDKGGVSQGQGQRQGQRQRHAAILPDASYLLNREAKMSEKRSFFSRLFGRNREAPPERISESMETLTRYVHDMMSAFGECHFQEDTMAKQILSVYAFGGVSALAIHHKMSQPQGHALCIALFVKTFGYSPGDSVVKANAVMTASSDQTSHLYPIIHRGLDGFLHWQEHGVDDTSRDFAEIMDHFEKGA